jgi:hypothetical protein
VKWHDLESGALSVPLELVQHLIIRVEVNVEYV